MNKTYRLVWNELTHTWIAVAENVRARGKRTSRALLLAAAGIAVLPGPTFAAPPNPPAATQLPTGGNVVAGQAGIAQTGAAMTVTQTSPRAAIDWQSFNIGSAAQVNFVQPSASSAILNRVLDPNPSQIFGRINANGQVFLTNPSGIYFGRTASVDVGAFTATTHSIANDDFMAGRHRLTRNGATGQVENEGNLTANLEGYIALLAPEVRNNGVIVARMGTVALAAGEAFDLQFDNARLSNVRVEPATLTALVENKSAVIAPDGLIILSARALDRIQGGVVKNSGTLEATGLTSDGGTIRLTASDRVELGGSVNADAAPNSAGKGGTATLIADLANPDSIAKVSGTISAKGGDLGGDGGFVETSASRVRVGDAVRIDTSAAHGKSGEWLIDPHDYTIAASGGDISGATLSTNLGSGNVTILSSSGSASGSGDIKVNDAVGWSANTLTLTAARDININAVMTAGGTSILTMNTATTNGGESGVTNGTVRVGLQSSGFVGRVDFSGRSGTGFLTINGSGYTVINSLGTQGSITGTDLQGINGAKSGKFALGANIDASPTSSWNSGAGFLPIGDDTNKFTGIFDGLGHTISGLTINHSGYACSGGNIGCLGLFGYASNAALRNTGLVGGSVSISSGTNRNYVGSLVGYVYASLIDNSYATTTVSGQGNVGGLVGMLAMSSSVLTNSFATGAVTSSTDGWGTGGLVGMLNSASIRNSYATGAVSGDWAVGGLVGDLYSWSPSVANSYATGSVTGVSYAGGLIGVIRGSDAGNPASVANSYATGNVAASSTNAGGLIGYIQTQATVSNGYATGAVSGAATNKGSLIGNNATGTVDSVFATGTVGGAAGNLIGTGGAATNAINYASAPTPTDNTWTGGAGDGLWSTAGNWSAGHIPTLTETAVLGGNTVKIPSNIMAWDVTTTTGATLNFTGTPVGSLALAKNSVVTLAATTTLNYGTAGKLNLPKAGTFSLNGTTYTVVTSLGAAGSTTGTDLQGINGNKSGNYVLGLDIDASGTSSWNANAGFLPIGDSTTKFTGVFDGLGHTVNKLTINRSGSGAYQGLFGVTSGASIRNVGLSGGSVSVRNYSGALIGSASSSTIANSFSTASFSGTHGNIGGLVGELLSSSTLTSSHATGNVTSGGTASNIGGLVGLNYASTISGSYATGTVSGGTDSMIGGLAGQNLNGGSITSSYATGNVTGKDSVGGLVGYNSSGNISNSYATGSVAASTLGVSDYDYFGGLVGYMLSGALSNNYARGSVTSYNAVGGLVGYMAGGTITNNYATGAVALSGAGAANAGGLIGYKAGGTVNTSYWDTQTTGQVSSSGSGGTYLGKTTAEMKTRSTYGTAWDFHSGSKVWNIGGVNDGYPYLCGVTATSCVAQAIQTIPVYLRLTAGSSIYGNTPGLTYVLYDASSGGNVVSDASPSGTVTWSTPLSATSAAATYSETFSSGITLGNSTYTLSAGSAADWVINPRPLTITAGSTSRSYGSANPSVSAFTAPTGSDGSGSGLVNGNSISSVTNTIAGTATATAAAGTTHAITPSAAVFGSGLSGNYNITYADGTLTIDRRPLTVSYTGVNKVYDRTTDATVTTSDDRVSNDVLTINRTAAFADKTVANGKTVSVSSVSLTGTDAGNYTVSSTGSTSANITAKALTLTGFDAANKTYDGTTTATISNAGSLSGVITGDTVTVSNSGATFDNKNVASGKTVTLNTVALGGDDAGNYSIAATATDTADITAAILPPTIVSNSASGMRKPIVMVRESLAQQTNTMTVLVLKEVVSENRGFIFPLPDRVVTEVANSATVRAVTLDGSELPDWLRFDPKTRSLVALTVPKDAFPMQVVIIAGTNRWTVVLSESAQ